MSKTVYLTKLERLKLDEHSQRWSFYLHSLCCPHPWRVFSEYAGQMQSYTFSHMHELTLSWFSRSVVSNSLQPHELQRTRLPCPSPSPEACLNSRPLSQRCHPTISSSVAPFSSCPQSFPVSGSFPVSQLFTSDGQGYWSFNFSIRPSNEYSGLISFRIDWLDLLAVQDSQESSPILQFKSINSLALSLLYGPTLTSIRDHWKIHSFDYTDLCQ